MVKMKITMVDGDQIEILVPTMDDATNWAEHHRGKYISVTAKEINNGGIEHDNDGADHRITRSGNC